MTKVSVKKWWKACEIPLVENEWRNIKLYCPETRDWEDRSACVYFIRLAPPYMIAYGPNEDADNPLIYIGKAGKAKLKSRWAGDHIKNKLTPLGHYLPGGRYEVWALEHPNYGAIESHALFKFYKHFTKLPLANRNGGQDQKLILDDSFTRVADADKRYWWALRPTHPVVKEYYEKGALQSEEPEA